MGCNIFKVERLIRTTIYKNGRSNLTLTFKNLIIMKKKNEKVKQTKDHVQELIDMGVKKFLAYAHYFDAKTENIVELYVWGYSPAICLAYFNLLLKKLEKGELVECIKKDSVVFLCTIHISEIHRFNPAILSNLFNLLHRINDDLDDDSGIYLTTFPDSSQQCSSIYIKDNDATRLSVVLDSTMGSGGFIN
jgi:hypothetical protein